MKYFLCYYKNSDVPNLVVGKTWQSVQKPDMVSIYEVQSHGVHECYYKGQLIQKDYVPTVKACWIEWD